MRVTFSYYVNFGLFCLMTFPSNCKIWGDFNTVDAYETIQKKMVDFENSGETG